MLCALYELEGPGLDLESSELRGHKREAPNQIIYFFFFKEQILSEKMLLSNTSMKSNLMKMNTNAIMRYFDKLKDRKIFFKHEFLSKNKNKKLS